MDIYKDMYTLLRLSKMILMYVFLEVYILLEKVSDALVEMYLIIVICQALRLECLHTWPYDQPLPV